MITPIIPVVALMPQRAAIPICPRCGARHAASLCPTCTRPDAPGVGTRFKGTA